MLAGCAQFADAMLEGVLEHPAGVVVGPVAAGRLRNGDVDVRCRAVSIADEVEALQNPFYDTAGGLVGFDTALFRQGVFASIEQDGVATIPLSGHVDGFDVLDALPVRTDPSLTSAWAVSTLFWRGVVGDRVKLTWDRADSSDFGAYVLYWNEGAGAPATELVVIAGRDVTEYLTDALGAGTFGFKIELQDIHGNESTGAATVSVTTGLIPDEPIANSAVYDQPTRVLTVTFDDNDEVWIHSNYIHGVGQAPLLNWEAPFAVKRSGGAVWVSPELWEGEWLFGFTKRNAMGLDGPAAEESFRLVKVGANLVEIVVFGSPDHVEATPIVAGDIDLSWTWTGETATANDYVEIWASADSAAYALADTIAATLTTYEFAGVGDVVYDFRLRAKYDDGAGVVDYGPYSNTARATADDTAPDDATNLAAEVVL